MGAVGEGDTGRGAGGLSCARDLTLADGGAAMVLRLGFPPDVDKGTVVDGVAVEVGGVGNTCFAPAGSLGGSVKKILRELDVIIFYTTVGIEQKSERERNPEMYVYCV